MSLRTALFGPSSTDKLIAVLREDRAQTTAVLVAFLDSAKATTALLQQQYALWTAPVGDPVVRVMTPGIEAGYERARAVGESKPLNPDDLLAALKRDFRMTSDTFSHA